MRHLFATLTVLAVLMPTAAAQTLQGGAGRPQLFEPVPPAQSLAFYEDYTATRQRNVLLNMELLSHDELGLNAGGKIALNLFEDVSIAADYVEVRPAFGGGFINVYDIPGDPNGMAFLSVVNEAMTATVRTQDRLFKVHHVGDGQHTVMEIDESLHAGCAVTDAHTVHADVQPKSLGNNKRFAGRTVDVLVVYTDDARANNGGTDGIISLCNLAICETNQGYANSDAEIALNMVGCREVTYNEVGGIGTWLGELRATADGIIDEVHTWRDDLGADMVHMVTGSGGGACGVAYKMGTLSATWDANAFAVTHDGCAVGNYTFGHEAGHNFGCCHDPANGSGGIFAYSFGHRTVPSNSYRTVMAYAPGARILFFSNPDKDAPNGEALGVAGAADNARSQTEAATTVSQWRSSKDFDDKRLTTTSAGGNQFRGNMFDIEPKTDLNITFVTISTDAGWLVPVSADVWYREGSYVGFENTSVGWKLLGSGVSVGPLIGDFSTISLPNTKVFEADQVYGMYVDLTSYGLGVQALQYTNGGPTQYSNNDLQITTGVGKGDPAFTGGTFTYREWNGIIWYKGAGGDSSLGTTFVSDNQFRGNMFDITPNIDMKLTGIDVNTSAAVGDTVSFDVYCREGTHVGFENSSAGWSIVASGSALSEGTDNPTYIPLDTKFLFTSGKTYGIYVDMSSYDNPVGSYLRYTNGGPTTYVNGDLTLVTGVGKGDPAFTGSTFTYREWNGRFYYKSARHNGLTTTFTDNNAFAGNMFDIEPKADIRLNGFDIHLRDPGEMAVDVWYRTDSYVGNESDSAGWIFLGRDSLSDSAGEGRPSRISVKSVDLSEGQTYGFYISLGSYPDPGSMLYTNGSNTYENSHMILTTGVGKGNGSFTGATFADRTWNGTVHYSVIGPELWVTNLAAGKVAEVHIANNTPNGNNFVSWSTKTGVFNWTDPCGVMHTTYLGLPYFTLPVIACNADGEGSITGNVSPTASGIPLYLQGWDQTACEVTNMVSLVIK